MPKIIICRGIGEPLSGSMLHNVTKQLKGWQVVVLDYLSEYGPVGGPITGQDFRTTLVRGQDRLLAELDKGPAYVIGYSAGAAIAGHVAALGHPNLTAVGLLADPFQPRNVIGSRATHWGVAGSRTISSDVLHQGNDRVKWFFDPADVICQCVVNSPIRTVADQTRALSLANPIGWFDDVKWLVAQHAFQAVALNWWNSAAIYATYKQAVKDAQGYLPPNIPGGRGDHTSYARRRQPNGRTIVDDMAIWLQSTQT